MTLINLKVNLTWCMLGKLTFEKNIKKHNQSVK